MADMKYTAKDSVFSFIFRQPENTRRLYLALHPEDSDVTEADCKLITLEHIGAVDKVPEIKRQGRFQARKKMPFGITLSI